LYNVAKWNNYVISRNTFNIGLICIFFFYRIHIGLLAVCACAFLVVTCDGKAAGYKYCLYECANCVQLWGEELYDGRKCATCCRYSDGAKLDPECKVWTTNTITYSKKDLDYVRGILIQKRDPYGDSLNYKYIFGDIPEFCFASKSR